MTLHKYKWPFIILLALIGVCFLVYIVLLNKAPSTSPNNVPKPATNNASGSSNISFSPPSKQDKQEAADIKQNIVDQPQTNANFDKKAMPLITSAGQYEDLVEVRAIVNGVYESGGSCTAIFVRNDINFTKATIAEKDATTTVCGPLNIPSSTFKQSGTWNVTIKYDSNISHGTSDSKQIEIK